MLQTELGLYLKGQRMNDTTKDIENGIRIIKDSLPEFQDIVAESERITRELNEKAFKILNKRKIPSIIITKIILRKMNQVLNEQLNNNEIWESIEIK